MTGTAPAAKPATPAWRLGEWPFDLLWLAIAALLTILPLLVRGTSCGHDLSFHLLNWMEVVSQWQGGTLRPWWAFHAAWAAGEPRFVFYPPLSWLLGADLGLVLPWTATPIAYTLVVLFGCGVTMRLLLRAFVSPGVALAGACLYLANPYMLMVAFERTAYAELLAAAWMPLLLLAALRLKLRPLLLAGVVTLLWLTNAPAAVVACYSLLCLGLVRVVVAIRSQGLQPALQQGSTLAWATALGIAGAGFYLIPAIVQRHFVQISMAILPGMRPSDNFLFHHTADPAHDAVLRSASWIAVGTLTFASLAALLLLSRKRAAQTFSSMHARSASDRHHTQAEHRFALLAATALTLVIAFLLTPISNPVWSHAPELQFLQFPWRFLSIEAAVAVFLGALAVQRYLKPGKQNHTLPALLATLAAISALAWTAHAAYAQPCDPEDTPAAQRALYVSGTGSEPTDEYTPTNADNDLLRPNLPQAWLAPNADGAPSPEKPGDLLQAQDRDPSHILFFIHSARTPRTLVLRRRQFPGWVVQLDGAAIHPAPERDDGLFTVPLAAGIDHQIELRYRWTPDEYAGLLLSLAALVIAVLRRWPLSRTPIDQPNKTSYNRGTA